MIILAEVLENGADGVSRDVKHATQLYEDAISKDADPRAMYHLAALRQRNLQDNSDGLMVAVQLYQRAIDEGDHVGAMVKLAGIFEYGAENIPANRIRAIKLYKEAAVKGCSVAMCQLATLLETDVDEHATKSTDLLRSVDWYCRAIQQGCGKEAFVLLANLLTLRFFR